MYTYCERGDATVFCVVVNDEEQYSIWPIDRDRPAGWHDAGRRGTEAECLEYVAAVWTDMRPRSLRVLMDAQGTDAASHSVPSAHDGSGE